MEIINPPPYKGFLPYMGMAAKAGHLGSWSCDQHHINKFLISMYLKGTRVPENKIFEGSLPYMGVAAILVM